MNRDAYLNVRVNKQQKEAAEKIFKELGLTLSDAVNVFLNQTILQAGFPFEVKIPQNGTAQNSETLQHFLESLKKNDELYKALAK